MTDQAFELRLQAAYDELADGASVEVDATTLAAVLARGRVRPSVRMTWPVFQRSGSLALVFATLLLIVALIAAAAVGALLLQRPRAIEGVFSVGPDMSVARDRPIVVALDDGRVVIAGGQYGTASELVPQIFDPATGNYSPLSGDVPTGTGNGLLLPDGRVLVTAYDLLRSERGWAGIYLLDPALMTSRFVSLPLAPYVQSPAPTPPFGPEPAIALLDNGNVLIIGDGAGTPEGSKGFVFNPSLETLTQVGSLVHPRKYPATATLSDGRVLVAGGLDPSAPQSIYVAAALRDDAEIFDPATNQFTSVGRLPSVRGNARSFVMPGGRVLIEHAGDTTTRFGDFNAQTVALDVYDPGTNTFTAHEPGNWHGPPTVTQLNDGRLLLTGLELETYKTWAATYDPVTNLLTPQVESSRAIFPQGATTVDGRTVLVGGFTDPPPVLGNPAVPWTDIFQ